MSAPSQRWPLEPLVRLARLNRCELARLVGVDRRQVYRWRDGGLPEDVADRLAIAIGLHPSNVWPDW